MKKCTKRTVVDGITVSVNLVYVTFSSLAFTASFQMSRILIESKTPTWQRANLQLTRLKDVDLAEVLTFKEISWQTVRIEAKSTVNKDLTPLRLITNQARCRITLKKRISDCSILGCRLVIILDDLLWVLTDDQLKAAVHFMDSISGLVAKATTTSQKAKAVRKLENQDSVRYPKSRNSSSQSTAAKTFQKYDVIETSYHFYSDRIDLHFCDDPGGGRSSHPDLAQGGAFQVSLSKLQIDYYPYHLARGDRKHWVRYSESPHKSWLQSNLAAFDTRLLDVLLSGRNHSVLTRAVKTPLGPAGGVGGGQGQQKGEPEDDAMRDLFVNQLSRLMTENVVVRLYDISVWCVATSTSPSTAGSKLQELLKGDHARLHLPEDIPFLHLEFTSFYYPGDFDFPLPPPILMVHMNPLTVWLDVLTLVWINAFILNLQKSLESLQASLDIEKSETFYADIKLEMLMPRIVCGARMTHKIKSSLKPSSLQIHASKISIANYRSLETGSRADLVTVLELFQQSPLFFGAEFPSRPQDVSIVCQKFVSHATGTDAVKEAPSLQGAFKKDLLWTDARDVWYVLIDSLWADFTVPCSPHRPVPLVDAVPLAAWVYAKPKAKSNPDCDKQDRPHRSLLQDFYSDKESTDITGVESSLHVMAYTTSLVSLQIDHHQLIFLLRLADSLSELTAFLSADTSNIDPTDSIVSVGAVIPQIDVSILLPSTQPSSYPVPSSPTLPLSQITVELDIERASVQSKILEAEPNFQLGRESQPKPGADADFRSSLHMQPVTDASDPLSSSTSQEYIHSSTSIQYQTSSHPEAPPSPSLPSSSPYHSLTPYPGPPSLKLPLAPVVSNGSIGRNRGIASSFNSLMGSMGLSSTKQEGHVSHLGSRSPDMDLDTLSVRSDESGESTWDAEGFVVLGSGHDMSDHLFSVQKDDRSWSPAEVATEVCEALDFIQEMRISTPCQEVQEMEEIQISVLTLHLGRLQFAQLGGASKPAAQPKSGEGDRAGTGGGAGVRESPFSSAQGDVSSILVSLGSLSLDPILDTSWKTFQNRFNQCGKGWSDSTLCPPEFWTAKLRLDSSPPAQPHLALQNLPDDLQISIGEKISRVSDGFLELRAKDLNLELVTSTIARLVEWSQDEILPSPLPILLRLQNICLHLEDDTPPPPGIPAPPPVDLKVSALEVKRKRGGELEISNPVEDTDVNASTQVQSREGRSKVEDDLETARTEILLLRQKLAEKDLNADKLVGETIKKQDELKDCQKQVEDLVLERQSLLNTLNYLQQELLRAGMK
ncbi:UHRF1-binding protein 1-like [Eurytemora carolleeae]|uniref:UHRF1-binding protein 1-like n=1 Tax=Eurytemora carolleeae TaxID=1294199 RepID=UPI000C75C4D4|nr:UHRF1-binding protein 1-like [Eurytemora carolleeae]|eukprot:XP_023344836.1 UHRF1-binding protein 1-like [Eurytemora affinis]